MATNSSTSTTIPKKTVQDFKFIKEIGTGSYSTVRRTNNFDRKIQMNLQIFQGLFGERN